MTGTNGGTSGTPTRYSVPEAARHLGISERAVRKRIKAGTLEAVREGRSWSVFIPPEQEPEPSGTNSGTSGTASGTSSDQLLAHLQAENARLWAEVEARREAERELRYIIARQAERLPELPAHTRGEENPEEEARDTHSGDDPETDTARPWWKFW